MRCGCPCLIYQPMPNDSKYPAALPPCREPSGTIEALYAARFIVIPWEALRQAISVSFSNDDPQQVLELLIRSSQGKVEPHERSKVAEAYRHLLQETTDLVREEVEHHRDLAQTPLWSLINGTSFLERLHLLRAQRRPGARRVDLKIRGQALSAAFRLHLFRRYLFVQVRPVLELLYVLGRLNREPDPRPVAELAYLASAMATPRDKDLYWLLAQKKFRGVSDIQRAIDETRQLAFWALSPNVVLPGGWLSCLDDVWDLCRVPGISSLSTEAMISVTEERSKTSASSSRSMTLPEVLLRYLWHARGAGLTPLLGRMAVGRFGRSILPYLRRLLTPDPYRSSKPAEREFDSWPGLRAFHNGHNIILDPPAMSAAGGNRVNYQGLENILSFDTTGYTVDQFILRRVCEARTDPAQSWTPKLEDFMIRWVGISSADRDEVRRVLDQTSPFVNRILARIEETVGHNGPLLTSETLGAHDEARKVLLSAIDSAEEPLQEAIHAVLHAYYIHGL